MVGGGPGAFIGAVHRKAAAMDGEIELVAGAFSSDEAKSRAQGAALHLDPRRVYASWREMVGGGQGLLLGAIGPPTGAPLETERVFPAGASHVVGKKPMTTTLEDAEELCR